MKIIRLEITNFKNIGHLVMDSIPDLVIIAGSNGTGKSSIFDAVRIFKEAYGSYHLEWGPGMGVRNMIKRIGQIVPEGATETKISAKIELSEFEQQKLGLDTKQLYGGISVDREGNVSNKTSNDGLEKLFNKYDLGSGIGIVEYIPPVREFPTETVRSWEFGDEEFNQNMLARVMTPHRKFERFKSDLLNLRMLDLQDHETGKKGGSGYIEEIKRIFHNFLPLKEFLGVIISKNNASPIMNVRTSVGTHSIDFLSSGEREILMNFTNIIKLKLTNSIILFDEPELHLNGDLERKVVSYLTSFLSESKSQIWIATHSTDIINSADYSNLYQTTGDPLNAIVPVLDLSEKIGVLKAMGASLGQQLISDKIIFVEGYSDEAMLRHLCPDLLRNTGIVFTGGKGTLLRINQVTSDYLRKAATYNCFFFIRDRDSETNEEIESLIKGHSSRFFVWNRYHLENYLIDSEAIFSLIKEYPEWPQLSSTKEVQSKLKEIADDMQKEVIAQRIGDELNRIIRKHVRINPREGIQKSLDTIAKRRLKLSKETLSPNNLSNLVQRVTKEVKKNWDTDWKSMCKGRDILERFLNRVLDKAMSYELFRGTLTRKIREMKRVHEDVTSVLSKIAEA